ncbi:MAG TPA: dihydrofolate reductase, partial [Pseudomonadales bacterium]|nr:dihydrofolate reductase [Pseudomonadales bacterium]
PIIMGRKTYESIGRPLPGRPNIVISTNPAYQAEGIHVVTSVEAARHLARDLLAINGGDEAMIIGGEQIYRLFMETIDRLYLTEVMAEVEGDAWFPAFDEQAWREVSCEAFEAEAPNPYDYRFRVLERR